MSSCDVKASADFKVEDKNCKQPHNSRRLRSPKGSDNIDGELRDLFSDALQYLEECSAVARTLFLLSYQCPAMTFLLIKRNCFYNTLTEIWVIAWVHTGKRYLYPIHTLPLASTFVAFLLAWCGVNLWLCIERPANLKKNDITKQ